MFFFPTRSETKKTHWESGENTGASDDFSPRVSCRRPLPSVRARNTCVIISLFSPSITACFSVQTAQRPSAEGTGAVTVFTFMESSGVHWASRAAEQIMVHTPALANIFLHPIQVALGRIHDEFRF